jgi:hypothetical protein
MKDKKVITYTLPEPTRLKLNELKWRLNAFKSDLVSEAVDDLLQLHDDGKLNECRCDNADPGKVSYSFYPGTVDKLNRLKRETNLTYVDIIVKAVDNLYIKHMSQECQSKGE